MDIFRESKTLLPTLPRSFGHPAGSILTISTDLSRLFRVPLLAQSLIGFRRRSKYFSTREATDKTDSRKGQIRASLIGINFRITFVRQRLQRILFILITLSIQTLTFD